MRSPPIIITIKEIGEFLYFSETGGGQTNRFSIRNAEEPPGESAKQVIRRMP